MYNKLRLLTDPRVLRPVCFIRFCNCLKAGAAHGGQDDKRAPHPIHLVQFYFPDQLSQQAHGLQAALS